MDAENMVSQDAYEMMFNRKLRTGRRLGATIIGHEYCNNYQYFSFMVHQLFNYQWFDKLIYPDNEVIQALYDNSKGIIDQLIGIYIFMQIDYLTASNKPEINAEYVNKIVDRHYPGLRCLLDNINDPIAEEKRAMIVRKGSDDMKTILNIEKQKMSSKDLLQHMNNEKDKERERIKNTFIQEMADYLDGYSLITIQQAVIKEMGLKTNEEANLSQLRKKIIRRLMSETKEGKKVDKQLGLDQIHIYMRNSILGD